MKNDNDILYMALQRQNERAAKMKMPDDMEQRVMNHIRPRKSFGHRWIYHAIATAAASILLLWVLNIEQKTTHIQQPKAQQSRELSDVRSVPHPIKKEKKEKAPTKVHATVKPMKQKHVASIKHHAQGKPMKATAEAPNNIETDMKARWHASELELERSTHLQQAAYEEEMRKQKIELLLYLLTDKEEEMPNGIVNTAKS